MRILVFSDIHSNLSALEAVLNAAGVDAYWCLGDIVGYGPDANECIARVKELPNLVCVAGIMMRLHSARLISRHSIMKPVWQSPGRSGILNLREWSI